MTRADELRQRADTPRSRILAALSASTRRQVTIRRTDAERIVSDADFADDLAAMWEETYDRAARMARALRLSLIIAIPGMLAAGFCFGHS